MVKKSYAWWRHQTETFSALLALCAGNSSVPGEFLAQRPVTRSFDGFFDLCPNKRLSKQWRCWLFATLSGSSWRHCNGGTFPIDHCLRRGSHTASNGTAWMWIHNDVIKWKHLPRYWHFVRGIHRSPVISPHKGQWRGALMFSLICARINGWVNNPFLVLKLGLGVFLKPTQRMKS